MPERVHCTQVSLKRVQSSVVSKSTGLAKKTRADARVFCCLSAGEKRHCVAGQACAPPEGPVRRLRRAGGARRPTGCLTARGRAGTALQTTCVSHRRQLNGEEAIRLLAAPTTCGNMGLACRAVALKASRIVTVATAATLCTGVFIMGLLCGATPGLR